jgi:maltose-binding protein MalE
VAAESEAPAAEPFPTGECDHHDVRLESVDDAGVQDLADGFHALHPNVTVQLKEYDPAQYDTLLTADLAAGSGPDIVTQKTFKMYYSYVDGGALLDISDVAGKLSDKTNGRAAYTIAGKTYGVPYRQDAWVLYYNKDLFDKAKVAYPTARGRGTTTRRPPRTSPPGSRRPVRTPSAPTSTRGSRPSRASRSRRPPGPT